MSKFLTGIAALALVGAATIPSASAAERQSGVTAPNAVQATDVSAQRRYYRGGYRYGGYGPRRYYGPRYGGYYRPYPYYGYYGNPYGYYRPGPFVSFGPFGFRF